MRRIRKFMIAGAWIPLLLLLGTGPTGTGLDSPVRAATPGEVPVFSNPFEFTNPYFPFQPGAMKVFVGQEDGVDMTVVRRHLPDPRTFTWQGGEITCAIVRETEFVDGDIIEISDDHYAQADDGSVWYFGELAYQYEGGEVVSHEGSWLVGGPGPGDPTETASAEDPGLLLPSDPEVGDEWTVENIPASEIHETRKVVRFKKKIKVPAGKFRDCVEIKEHDFDGERERKWYAPGTGVVRVRSDDERLKLVATTIRPR